MHDPELLIMDEPIAGLDPVGQQSFHVPTVTKRACYQ